MASFLVLQCSLVGYHRKIWYKRLRDGPAPPVIVPPIAGLHNSKLHALKDADNFQSSPQPNLQNLRTSPDLLWQDAPAMDAQSDHVSIQSDYGSDSSEEEAYIVYNAAAYRARARAEAEAGLFSVSDVDEELVVDFGDSTPENPESEPVLTTNKSNDWYPFKKKEVRDFLCFVRYLVTPRLTECFFLATPICPGLRE
ncbi:hypothetical protein CROQUDRAFT_86825 [Cronartium quercuum f. sp. fusiforme G11]|uniref:Uncharacterized protein n=1 Tax=Cronartium quercuum f. sp. fusiforme G11 TaxID=708437 RepID=A0A9P6NTM0_9BASI|nr:hypothetical protein CROQUDRAFT_86825 [Cronartium quercuum f. sp. fusiforme G11]